MHFNLQKYFSVCWNWSFVHPLICISGACVWVVCVLVACVSVASMRTFFLKSPPARGWGCFFTINYFYLFWCRAKFLFVHFIFCGVPCHGLVPKKRNQTFWKVTFWTILSTLHSDMVGPPSSRCWICQRTWSLDLFPILNLGSAWAWPILIGEVSCDLSVERSRGPIVGRNLLWQLESFAMIKTIYWGFPKRGSCEVSCEQILFCGYVHDLTGCHRLPIWRYNARLLRVDLWQVFTPIRIGSHLDFSKLVFLPSVAVWFYTRTSISWIHLSSRTLFVFNEVHLVERLWAAISWRHVHPLRRLLQSQEVNVADDLRQRVHTALACPLPLPVGQTAHAWDNRENEQNFWKSQGKVFRTKVGTLHENATLAAKMAGKNLDPNQAVLEDIVSKLFVFAMSPWWDKSRGAHNHIKLAWHRDYSKVLFHQVTHFDTTGVTSDSRQNTMIFQTLHEEKISRNSRMNVDVVSVNIFVRQKWRREEREIALFVLCLLRWTILVWVKANRFFD